MVSAWVLASDDDGVCLVKVIKRDCAFTNSDGCSESCAAGFVAHVRAVREIISSVEAGEELV